jgi:single-stranded-DNA-specific exonuclease
LSDGSARARLEDPGAPQAEAEALRAAYGLSFTGAAVLARQRPATGDLERWLDPKLSHLTPPAGMVDRDAATERIARAIREREKICVFGDYDCDGITACAILTERHARPRRGGDAAAGDARRGPTASPSLRSLGCRRRGATLLVTCDCGSSDHERIETARPRGIDTVVIDHHLVPKEPLPGPRVPEPAPPRVRFPFKHLASCGLALSAWALRCARRSARSSTCGRTSISWPSAPSPTWRPSSETTAPRPRGPARARDRRAAGRARAGGISRASICPAG